MPQKRTHKGAQVIAIITAVLLLCVAGFCAYLLIHNQQQKAEQKAMFATIAEKVDAAESELGDLEQIGNAEDKRVAQLLEVYRELHSYNSDFVGWIRVPGTEINYPVMQSPDEPNFYLRRNFEKEYSNLGTPYLQENCDIRTCDNLIIYGHHMLDGGMFSDLELYKKEAFFEQHKYVRFDTLDELGLYEVMAVIITTAYQSDSFQYYNYTENNELTFNTYVDECKQRALYDTGMDAEYGDKLITLSTCEYSSDNGRLIVVAKKIGGVKR
ncbi:class B sortase [Neglectibacter sp. CSJ-5]|uniref:class B sortase n=1 Tax=Neglectibacter sp. CSJ-5 TaxID=3078043 RepID=UPI0029305FB7|nr:class B sortase [Neglectibacter sp. CSJ-5]